MPHRDIHPAITLRDTVLIGGVLTGINLALSRPDFGWLTLNPTPWVLLPIMIGARYGLGWGLISGVAAPAWIVLMRSFLTGQAATVMVANHLYSLGALLMIGFLAGQWRRWHKTKLLEVMKENRGLVDRLQGLEAEVSLTMEARQDIQCQLALHNVMLVNLDEDLKRLMAAPSGEFLPGLLALLHQHTRVTSAALYICEGERLKRVEAMHPTPPLRETLDLGQTPLAAKALDEMSIAAVKCPVDTTIDQPFLAAFPWSDGHQSGVLLVQDMPLDGMSWENLSRVELVLHWAFSLARWCRRATGPEGRRLVPMEELMLLMGQALQVEHTHRVPSVVLRADFEDPAQAQDAAMGKALLNALPQLSVAARLPAKGSLVVLLPFGSQADGEALGHTLKATGAKLRCVHYVTSGLSDVQKFWQRLMDD